LSPAALHKYTAYLEKVVQSDESDYAEVVDLLNRHKTLSEANRVCWRALLPLPLLLHDDGVRTTTASPSSLSRCPCVSPPSRCVVARRQDLHSQLDTNVSKAEAVKRDLAALKQEKQNETFVLTHAAQTCVKRIEHIAMHAAEVRRSSTPCVWVRLRVVRVLM
jgi:hypothetical protein